MSKLDWLNRLPFEEAKAEFGVKFSADAGVVIARTTGEAHLVVTLTWGTGGG